MEPLIVLQGFLDCVGASSGEGGERILKKLVIFEFAGVFGPRDIEE